MTELDMMRKTWRCLNALASGIDPTTNEPIPENHIMQKPAIRECIQFSLKIIENQANEIKKKTAEQLVPEEQKPTFSAEKCSLRQVYEQLRCSISDRQYSAISENGIGEWLESQGLLEKRIISGRNYRRVATEKAADYGIVNHFDTAGGNFRYVSFDSHAQQFLYDSVQEISDFCIQHQQEIRFPAISPDLKEVPKMEIVLFTLSEEQKANLHPFADEAKMKEITDYLNSAIDQKQVIVKNLKYGTLSDWLASNGFLELIPSIDKYKTTLEGEKIGIICRWKVWNQFKAPRLFYTRAAQQYIFDHVDDLIQFNILEN